MQVQDQVFCRYRTKYSTGVGQSIQQVKDNIFCRYRTKYSAGEGHHILQVYDKVLCRYRTKYSAGIRQSTLEVQDKVFCSYRTTDIILQARFRTICLFYKCLFFMLLSAKYIFNYCLKKAFKNFSIPNKFQYNRWHIKFAHSQYSCILTSQVSIQFLCPTKLLIIVKILE